jgi:hypothetical protein
VLTSLDRLLQGESSCAKDAVSVHVCHRDDTDVANVIHYVINVMLPLGLAALIIATTARRSGGEIGIKTIQQTEHKG